MRSWLRLLALALFLLGQFGAFGAGAGAAARDSSDIGAHFCGTSGAPGAPANDADGLCSRCVACLAGAQVALETFSAALPAPSRHFTHPYRPGFALAAAPSLRRHRLAARAPPIAA